VWPDCATERLSPILKVHLKRLHPQRLPLTLPVVSLRSLVALRRRPLLQRIKSLYGFALAVKLVSASAYAFPDPEFEIVLVGEPRLNRAQLHVIDTRGEDVPLLLSLLFAPARVPARVWHQFFTVFDVSHRVDRVMQPTIDDRGGCSLPARLIFIRVSHGSPKEVVILSRLSLRIGDNERLAMRLLGWHLNLSGAAPLIPLGQSLELTISRRVVSLE
jgi:hypothetical protein